MNKVPHEVELDSVSRSMEKNSLTVERFRELSNLVASIRDLVFEFEVCDFDSRLGHYGLSGEFVNGMGVALNQVSIDTRNNLDHESICENFNRTVLERAALQSKLSGNSLIAGDLEGKETSLEAIPRAIGDIRKWMTQNADMPDDTRSELETLLNSCADLYEPVKIEIEEQLKLQLVGQ